MSEDALSAEQLGPFTRRAAGRHAVYWQMAAGGGGLSRLGAEGRDKLARSKPYPSQLMSGNLPALMETLAPGSTTLRQRTRRLN